MIKMGEALMRTSDSYVAKKLSNLLFLSLILFITIGRAEQEMPLDAFKRSAERRLSVDGNEMMHMPIHTTPLYGNSTDFMYYYITVYFGTHQ